MIAACTGSSRHAPETAAGARATQATGTVAFELYTHCGVDEARVGPQYYEAVHPLIEDGNPPSGWGDPGQEGTMTLQPPTQAIFTDNLGHRVVFRLRPHATRFKHICA
jgi:hypothetical protein